MRWTRRRTVIGDGIRGDHWAILCNGVQVGSTYYAINYRGAQWAWSTLTYPGESGAAETLEAALERVRAGVLASSGRVHPGTSYEARLW